MLSEEGKRVKKELEELREWDREQQSIERQLKRWEDVDNLIKGASLAPMVQGGERITREEMRVLEIDELRQLLKSRAIELANKITKFKIDAAKLDEETRNMLEARYIEGKTPREIERMFCYADRTVRHKYQQAFEKLAKY